MAPYIGDLAKVGKLPKLIRSVGRLIDVAQTKHRLAGAVRPIMRQLDTFLHRLPLDRFPGAVRTQLVRLREKVRQFVRNACFVAGTQVWIGGPPCDRNSLLAFDTPNGLPHCISASSDSLHLARLLTVLATGSFIIGLLAWCRDERCAAEPVGASRLRRRRTNR